MDGTRTGGFSPVSVPDGYGRFMLGQLFEPWAAELVARTRLQPEPYPRAFDSDSYRLSVADLHGLLQSAGFRGVRVETVELDATWPTAEAATATLLGTPFGPLVSVLPADAQQQLRARLASKLGNAAHGVTVRSASNIAQGVK
jgi:hypothetical protein